MKHNSPQEKKAVAAQRGMHTPGIALRRAMLEALFILGAILQRPVLADRFLAADNYRVLQSIRTSSDCLRMSKPCLGRSCPTVRQIAVSGLRANGTNPSGRASWSTQRLPDWCCTTWLSRLGLAKGMVKIARDCHETLDSRHGFSGRQIECPVVAPSP